MNRPAQPEIIAHRGLHDIARENTLDAFDRASTAGASAVELDVHSSADGVIVVHHDFDIAAPAGRLSIADSSLEQLRVAAAANSFELPTLSEVLNRFSGTLKVYVEVKAPGIELPVARIVRESSCALAVHSFDHRIVQTVRDYAPGLETGVLIVSRPIDPAAVMRAANAIDYWPQFDFVDQELVDHIHEAGGRVVAWTANSPEQWKRLTKLGVDGICTDHPDALRDWQQ